MINILCRTKGNASPKGKPRVYFTCHPQDFEKYFDRICEDLFKTQDCAVYYTENMEQLLENEEFSTVLDSNNLFIIPVTFRLLRQPNRAMNMDIPYAIEKNIPLLPIMMEPGLDAMYTAKFGELQYLNPFSTDQTEISYAEKLRKYLEAVLISDEMAAKIRAEFNAYIFLSYRKKDRRYANELMRLIHSNPVCRDIAIWYDEFLTPGESFRENIDKALATSKVFALLVTPNLLEEPDGVPNFVMGEEYPAALRAGIDILPAEMVETDKTQLAAKYPGIPDCVNPRGNKFLWHLPEALAKIAGTPNNDPAHVYLMGLAYLDGVDVETNRDQGLLLIHDAAEQNLPEAMEKLYTLYDRGIHLSLDYRWAAHWAEKLVEYYRQTLGQEHSLTLIWQNNLASTYEDLGEYQKAKELHRQVYDLRIRLLGKHHPDTLLSLNNLAVAYGKLGETDTALMLYREAYRASCMIFGEEHPETVSVLGNLSVIYSAQGDYKKAVETDEKVYNLYRSTLGEYHPDTLLSLNNLAVAYAKLGEYAKALELGSLVYRRRCEVLGAEHPGTLNSMNSLAVLYKDMGDYPRALEWGQQVYDRMRNVLGAEHPDTLETLGSVATIYGKLGDYQQELELENRIYSLQCTILGEEHPDTLMTLSNLAVTYTDLGEHETALRLKEKVFVLRSQVLGDNHPDTLVAMNNLANSYAKAGDLQRALAVSNAACNRQIEQFGEENPTTLSFLSHLAKIYRAMDDLDKTVEILLKVYTLRRKLLGDAHPDTVTTVQNLAVTYNDLRDFPRAMELHKAAYTYRCDVLGEEHPSTIRSLGHYAVAVYRVGEYRKAAELMHKCYLLYQKVNGNSHPETQRALKNFRTCCRRANLCQHCGGTLIGKDIPICVQCGKPKDY